MGSGRELSRWPASGTADPVTGASLADVLDRILDKGVVVNADISVSIVGVELLGIKLRAAVASFETAARYGLEFPSGVDLDAPAWREVLDQAPSAAMNGCRPARPAMSGRGPASAGRSLGPGKEDSRDGAATNGERGRRRARGGERPEAG